MKTTPIYLLLVVILVLSKNPVAAQIPEKGEYLFPYPRTQQIDCVQSIKEYDEALKLEPQNYKYHYAKGKCYYRMKEDSLAIASLEACLAIQKNHINAWRLLATTYTRTGNTEKAVYCYDQAFVYEEDPSRKVSYKMYAAELLVNSGKPKEARMRLAEALALDSLNSNILCFDAKIANSMGDFESARNHILAALPALGSLPPEALARYYFELGKAYRGLGDNEAADKAWEKASYGKFIPLIEKERQK